jgi:hypothetical protein
MSGYGYGKIRSWHIIRTPTRGGWWVSLCGRRIDLAPVQSLPLDQKSCETCLRLATREQ